MNKKNITRIAIILIATISLSSCNKNDHSFQDAILGKWELISQGTINDVQQVECDGSYFECFRDGKMIKYSSETNEFSNHTYRIDSKYIVDNHLSADYDFSFTKDTLILTHVQGPEYVYIYNNIYIYQRKK